MVFYYGLRAGDMKHKVKHVHFVGIGGSGMSGHAIWAVIGIIVGAAGVFLVVRTLRTPSARDNL